MKRGMFITLVAGLGMVGTLVVFFIGVAPLAYLRPPHWVAILAGIVIGFFCYLCLLVTWRILKKVWKGTMKRAELDNLPGRLCPGYIQGREPEKHLSHYGMTVQRNLVEPFEAFWFCPDCGYTEKISAKDIGLGKDMES